jgi:Sir2- and TIR-associating SLOG family
MLGSEIIKRGYNLVSGFGLGIAGACIIGAHGQARCERSGRVGQRLRLHPFPQEFKSDAELKQSYTDFRKELINESGATIFIAGNKFDQKTQTIVVADGVLEEFELAKAQSHILIPVPGTGWVCPNLE